MFGDDFGGCLISGYVNGNAVRMVLLLFVISMLIKYSFQEEN